MPHKDIIILSGVKSNMSNMFNARNLSEMIITAEKAYLLAKVNNLSNDIIESYRDCYYKVCSAASRIEAEAAKKSNRMARAMLGLPPKAEIQYINWQALNIEEKANVIKMYRHLHDLVYNMPLRERQALNSKYNINYNYCMYIDELNSFINSVPLSERRQHDSIHDFAKLR